MNYKYTIPTLFILTSITLTSPARGQNLPCPKEVDDIAQNITVLIENKNGGSGTIIKRDGNTYTVLTSFHNVADKSLKYTLVTPDGQRYPIDVINLRPLAENIDLTVVQFNSSKSYQVAKIGNSDNAKRRDNVYIAGFPDKTGGINAYLYECRDGQVSANATQATIDSGYNLIYTNKILKGMSGGPVLNQQGELIGINGLIEENEQGNTDRYGAVPINVYMRIASGARQPVKPTGGELKADDYYALAAQKYQQKDYRGVIVASTEVIRLTPNNVDAYIYRGLAKSDLGEKQAAIQDYNQAIKINPNYDLAYYNRGVVRDDLGEKQAAIQDYNQAIQINPNYAAAYYNRGNTKSELGEKQAAIQDYNQAIQINPNYAQAYINRGNAKSELGEKQAAIQDYNQAIQINPKLAQAYNNRGNAKSDLGDKQAAIQDYNQAIKINPNYAQAYNNRGVAKSALGEKQAAIQDYNQAIKINPNYANAYYNRGNAKSALGNKFQAISDFEQSARLYQQQGKNEDYQDALNRIRRLQQ